MRSAIPSIRPRGASSPSTAFPAGDTLRASSRRRTYEEYDLLIGMEGANLKNMQRICGGDPAGKMHRLLDYTDRPGDVADPWYTGDFEATWRDVSTGCQGLLASIQNKNV